jgi:hypothetical protein
MWPAVSATFISSFAACRVAEMGGRFASKAVIVAPLRGQPFLLSFALA